MVLTFGLVLFETDFIVYSKEHIYIYCVYDTVFRGKVANLVDLFQPFTFKDASNYYIALHKALLNVFSSLISTFHQHERLQIKKNSIAEEVV